MLEEYKEVANRDRFKKIDIFNNENNNKIINITEI